MKNKRKVIIIIFVALIILIFFFSGFSMGKEFTKKDIKGNTKVAKPLLEVENGSSLEINNFNKEGVYEFKIKNYNKQGEKTEVDLEYYIEVLNDFENTGIEINLFRNEQKIDINNNKTEKFILSKDEIKEDNYKLEVLYNEDKNINMEDIISQLQIKVHSEQMQEVL